MLQIIGPHKITVHIQPVNQASVRGACTVCPRYHQLSALIERPVEQIGLLWQAPVVIKGNRPQWLSHFISVFKWARKRKWL